MVEVTLYLETIGKSGHLTRLYIMITADVETSLEYSDCNRKELYMLGSYSIIGA
jgi:hypothetical protein